MVITDSTLLAAIVNRSSRGARAAKTQAEELALWDIPDLRVESRPFGSSVKADSVTNPDSVHAIRPAAQLCALRPFESARPRPISINFIIMLKSRAGRGLGVGFSLASGTTLSGSDGDRSIRFLAKYLGFPFRQKVFSPWLSIV